MVVEMYFRLDGHTTVELVAPSTRSGIRKSIIFHYQHFQDPCFTLNILKYTILFFEVCGEKNVVPI